MLKIAHNRHDSESEKWSKYKGQDILPMWVADSEFETAPAILEALKKRLEHGVLGYPELTQRFKDAVVQHCKRLYDWEVEADWVLSIPGVVTGLNLARALSIQQGKPHGLTFDPVYPHLRRWNPMLAFSQTTAPCYLDGDSWQPDVEALVQAYQEDTGLLLLCHPHNPLGMVFSDAQLEALAAFAQQRDLLVCSDEIHCDLMLNGARHRPFATLSADAAQRSITLMAASKTYNVAGLYTSFAIIPNTALRQQFQALRYGLVGESNLLGQMATIAALEEGEAWRQAHLSYLRDNAQLVKERIDAMPLLKTSRVDATFLAWIDASALGVANPQAFFEAHGVGLSAGADFGAPQYVRLNFGCGREILVEALQRIENAVRHHQQEA